MEQLSNLIPFSLTQVVGPIIAVMIAMFGFWFHERMRLQHYFGELRVWGAQCLDILSEAVHLTDLEPSATTDPVFYNRRHTVLVNLSSKIDQGRWFFPNYEHTELDKFEINSLTSVRQRPLDNLVYAYGVVKHLSYTSQEDNKRLKAPLVELKKDFTNSIQALLDPQKAHKQFGLAMKGHKLLK